MQCVKTSFAVFVVMLYKFPIRKNGSVCAEELCHFQLGVVVRTQIGFPPIPPVHKHTGWESIGGEGEILNTQIKA